MTTTMIKAKQLNFTPVDDIASLKAITRPKNGHRIEVQGEGLYSFNVNDTTGITADDGTTGSWFKLSNDSIKVEKINADTTAVSGTTYIVDTTSGVITVTLPVTTGDDEVIIKNVGDNNVKVLPSNSGAIDGETEYLIIGKNTSKRFVSSDNDEWRLSGEYTPIFENINPATITFNNGTVNGGETTGKTYEGVTSSRFVVDLASDKILDSANITSTGNVVVVDEWYGVIEVQQDIGGGNLTVDLAFKDKPDTNFANTIELFSTLGAHYLVKNTFFNTTYTSEQNKYVIYNSTNGNPPFAFNDEGIESKCITCRGSDKYGISDGGINLANNGFLISAWVKIIDKDGGSNNVYIFGNQDSGNNSKALHIGWTEDDRFKVGFYGADVNINNISAPYRYQDIKNKWTHVAIRYNYSDQKSTVFINGNNIGDGTHGARYESNFDLLFGRFDTTTTYGKISQLRVIRRYQNDVGISDAEITSIYNNELPLLTNIS